MVGSDCLRSFIVGYGSSPSRHGPACMPRSDASSPRFRRNPFVRDEVLDHGRASAPRVTAPHMLPSAMFTASASAGLYLSRLNSSPCTIAVYASQRLLPSAPQHSLPSARYGLLGPDFHRLDRASILAHEQNTAFRSRTSFILAREHERQPYGIHRN